MDKQKQIEEIVKLDIEKSVSGYSAFINDMRISKSKPLSVSKTIMSFDCPKKYILEAIGIPEGAVVLTREEYERLLKEETLCERFGNDIDAKLKYIYELEDKVAQARKETAEKFAEKIFELFPEDKNVTHIHRRTVKGICKEITEGKV